MRSLESVDLGTGANLYQLSSLYKYRRHWIYNVALDWPSILLSARVSCIRMLSTSEFGSRELSARIRLQIMQHSGDRPCGTVAKDHGTRCKVRAPIVCCTRPADGSWRKNRALVEHSVDRFLTVSAARATEQAVMRRVFRIR